MELSHSDEDELPKEETTIKLKQYYIENNIPPRRDTVQTDQRELRR